MIRELTLLLTFSASGLAAAQSGGSSGTTRSRIGFVSTMFSGEKYKGLTNKSTGVGVEMGIIKWQGRFGGVTAKIRGLYASGREDIMDGSTAYSNVSHTLFAAEPGVGVHLNILPFTPPGLRVYLLGVGLMSYDHIRLDKSISFSTINNSDTHIGFGYELGTGLELVKSWSLWGEIQYRQVTTKLVGQDKFHLTGLQAVIGIGW